MTERARNGKFVPGGKPPAIPRTGRPTTLTLEWEAVEILRHLSQGSKTQGALVSFLLRQEEQRRRDIREYRAREQQTAGEA